MFLKIRTIELFAKKYLFFKKYIFKITIASYAFLFFLHLKVY